MQTAAQTDVAIIGEALLGLPQRFLLKVRGFLSRFWNVHLRLYGKNPPLMAVKLLLRIIPSAFCRKTVPGSIFRSPPSARFGKRVWKPESFVTRLRLIRMAVESMHSAGWSRTITFAARSMPQPQPAPASRC